MIESFSGRFDSLQLLGQLGACTLLKPSGRSGYCFVSFPYVRGWGFKGTRSLWHEGGVSFELTGGGGQEMGGGNGDTEGRVFP